MPVPTFDRELTFTTERLELRHLLPAHATFLSELYSSSAFQHGTAEPTPFPEDKAVSVIEGIFSDVRRKFGYSQFLVKRRETGAPIGTVSLMRGDYLLPDVGYAILGEYTGHGYATEAASGLVAYTKLRWGLQGVFAFMDKTNARSQCVAAKIGLEYRGTRRLAAFGGMESAVWAEPAMDQDLTVYGIADDDVVDDS